MKQITKTTVFGFFLFFGTILYAQDTTLTFRQLVSISDKGSTQLTRDYQKIDTTIPEFRKVYQRVLGREFERILTGSNTSIGNFGTLSTADDLLQLNGMVKLWKNSSLGVNIHGGVTEGITELITGGETNPNIGAKLTLNFGLFNEHSKLTIDATAYEQFKNSLEKVSIKTLNDRAEIDLDISKKQNEVNEARYKSSLAELKLTQLRPIHDSLIKVNEKSYTQKTRVTIDSLNLAISGYMQDSLNYTLKSKAFDRELNLLRNSDFQDARRQKLEEEKVASGLLDEQKLSIKYYKLHWFSLSAEIENRAFKSFADSLPYGEQFAKQSFNHVKFELRRNRFVSSDSTLGSYFLSFGFAYSLNDNFDDLDKVTIDDVKPISITQNMKTSTTGYIGAYEKGIMRSDLFVDFYWFLNRSRTFAFHINPTLVTDIRRNGKSQLNSRFGMLFEFQKPNKEGFFNAELFYDISKIGTKLDDDERFDDRTLLGVNLNIPFQFKPSN